MAVEAPHAFIDRVDTLKATELHGVLTSITRVARIVGLRSLLQEDQEGNPILDDEGEPLPIQDYQILQRALETLGVPGYGDKLEGPGFEALIMVDRDVKMDNDPDIAEVTLVYKQALLEESAQRLGVFQQRVGEVPEGTPEQGVTGTLIDSISDSVTGEGQGIIYGRFRCTLQQKPANFYWRKLTQDEIEDTDPETPIDIGPFNSLKPGYEKNLITVEHDFKKDQEEGKKINERYSQMAGSINVQGGTIHVQQPMKLFDFSGTIGTRTPWLLANQLIGTINSNPWQSEPIFSWMCTEVTYQIITLGFYKFSFQFTNNPDTWLYEPMWIGPDGQPHPDARFADEAHAPHGDHWKVHYHNEDDFNRIFGAFFEEFQADIH